MNKFNLLDKLCINIDQRLKALTPLNEASGRSTPDQALSEPSLTSKEKRISVGLMRVNHAGEVCAQALYLGQGLTAGLTRIRTQMVKAAQEEVDHLNWCKKRLTELNSHPSYLNPLWFTGSFIIGAMAGLVGDRWSLGFVAETERQVVEHLEKHLCQLPKKDIKSQKIIEQMHEDEEHHRQTAVKEGAIKFPLPMQIAMKWVSKVMTTTAYWI